MDALNTNGYIGQRSHARWVTTIVAPLIVVSGARGATAGNTGADWSGPVYRITDGALSTQTVPGSPTTITRDDSRVRFTFDTSELEPMHAYTVWLVVWNFPEFCQDPDEHRGFRCGQGDVLNVTAGFSIVWGTGDVAGASARRFEGEREALDPERAFGPGLLDPQGAEIHLALRDHGPCSTDEAACDDQVSTHDGGCSNPMFLGLEGRPGDYECTQIQATGY